MPLVLAQKRIISGEMRLVIIGRIVIRVVVNGVVNQLLQSVLLKQIRLAYLTQ